MKTNKRQYKKEIVMNKKKIEQYIKEQKTVNIPTVQNNFSIDYKTAKQLFQEFIKKGMISFQGPLDYSYCDDYNEEKYLKLMKLKTEIESKSITYKKAVKLCVMSGEISYEELQDKLEISEYATSCIFRWLSENAVIEKQNNIGKSMLTAKEYNIMFENENVTDISEKENEDMAIQDVKESLEARKQEILQKIQQKIEEDNNEEDENYEEKENEETGKCDWNEDKLNLHGNVRRRLDKITPLPHITGQKNGKNLKFFYPKSATWKNHKVLYNNVFNTEMAMILISVNTRNEAIDIAEKNIRAMIDCKNYFRAYILENILRKIGDSNEKEFGKMINEAWKYIITTDKENYFLIKDSELTLYKGKWKTLFVPDGVIKIGNGLLDDDDYDFIREVEMPDSVKEIGDNAFCLCDNLDKVSLSSNLEKIGSNAFFEANGLMESDLPKSLYEIGEGAFCRSDIETVRLGDKINVIKKNVFKESLLQSITISKSVDKIEENAFKDCCDLKEVVFVGGKKDIDECAFDGCQNIKTIKFIGTAEELESVKQDLYAESECVLFVSVSEDVLPANNISDKSETIKNWTQKTIKGFPSLDVKNVKIIFQKK